MEKKTVRCSGWDYELTPIEGTEWYEVQSVFRTASEDLRRWNEQN